VPEIFVFIEKGKKFNKRVEINWDDGALSVIRRDEIILRGKDGQTYNVSEDSVHGIICRQLLSEQGFSLS
jgi:hypothetical protein